MPIMPSCPYERAKMRVAADVVNKKVCSKYYHVLVRQDPREQREGFEALVAGLDEFGSQLDGGPFYGGRSTPGLVDYALFPWAHRLPVFVHYRESSTRYRKTRRGCGRTTSGSPRCTRCQRFERRVRLGTTTSRTSGGTPTAARGVRWRTRSGTGGTRTSTTTSRTTRATEMRGFSPGRAPVGGERTLRHPETPNPLSYSIVVRSQHITHSPLVHRRSLDGTSTPARLRIRRHDPTPVADVSGGEHVRVVVQPQHQSLNRS